MAPLVIAAASGRILAEELGHDHDRRVGTVQSHVDEVRDAVAVAIEPPSENGTLVVET